MNLQRNSFLSVFEKTLPWLILVIMLSYTYAKFLGHPYGLRWDASTGSIIHVFDKQPEPTFRVGDQIIQIGDITWKEFSHDLHKTFFVGVKPGDVVPSIVERNGQTVNIDWVYPREQNRDEFLDQLISEWFIAYFFWLAGLLTILLVRPRDDRWMLMAFFNFLTAIWLIVGSGVSAFHIWDSAMVLRVAVLLCMPVYLHLHWVFPQPLGEKFPIFLKSVYAITLVLVVTQLFQILPESFFLFGFLIAFGGSFTLLLIHILRQPSARRDLRLLFVAVLLAMALAVTWEIVYSLNTIPTWLGSAGLLGLPLIPLAYLYSAFRRRLGGLEMRVNRFFSIYLFVILLGIVEVPLIVLFERVAAFPGKTLAISIAGALLTAAAFIWGYPPFEKLIDHRIFGIPLTSKRLLETYSTHITTSLSLSDLVRVLCEEVFPSLLIRQFAFLQYDAGFTKCTFHNGIGCRAIAQRAGLARLASSLGFLSFA